jgi:hypothetical protein
MRKYIENNRENILNRRPFKTDTFSGYPVGDGYCVDSYATTIACYSNETKTWYLTDEKFSQTTGTQQHGLRVILSKYITLSSNNFNAQVREIV